EQNKRLTVDVIKEIKMKVPANEKGEYDLKKQQEIIEKYKIIKEIQNEVEKSRKEISKLVVDIERKRERKREQMKTGGIYLFTVPPKMRIP
ncbi:10290_t:CDS:2, partial [Paraglomus occultum]